jgi:hypothetical protein
MIIRHAEKPGDIPPPYAVRSDGEQDVESLIVQGWKRSGGLVSLFAPSSGQFKNSQLAVPSRVYAVTGTQWASCAPSDP